MDEQRFDKLIQALATGTTRRLLAALVLVALLPLVGGRHGAAAQADDATYTSPTYGYTLSWDPAVWTVASDYVGSFDSLTLQSELATFLLSGTDVYDDLPGCLAGAIAGFQIGEGAPAEGIAGPTPAAGAAAALMAYDLPQDDGTVAKAVAYFECRWVEEGESTLTVTLLAAAEAFAEVLPLYEDLIAGLEVPGADDGAPPDRDVETGGPPIAEAGAGTPGADGGEPPDLAAMTLTPEDLAGYGLAGYGVGFGEMSFPDAVIASLAESRGLSEDEVREILEDAGFARRYDSYLYLPDDAADPAGPVGRMVVSYVLEFADVDGAAAAWEFLEDESGSATAEDVQDFPRLGQFGDELEATRDRGEDSATGDPFATLDTSFRLGRLHAGVAIVDWHGDEPPLADGEKLARRLLERVESTLDEGFPGLGSQVLRLTGGEIVPSADYYLLRDGEALPIYGESAADVDARMAAAAGIDQTDGYRLWQQIAAGGAETDDDVWYLVELLRFADEDAAAGWLADTEDRIGRNAAFEAVEIDAGAPEVGDESIGYTLEAADGGARYRGISLRVGDTVAAIDVIAPETPPAEVVEAFAESQAACLGTTGCVEPLPLPDDPWDLHAASDGSGRNVDVNLDVGKIVPDQTPEDDETSEREGDGGAIAGGETYVSPAWGYTIRWDPEMWVAMPESADDGRQFHIAGSVLVMVRITGVEGYGGDADACLAGIVDSSNDDDEEDDPPLVLAEGRQAPATAAGAAGAVYDIGTFAVAYYECRTLVEGESALQVRFVAPARAYDMVLPALEELLAGIEVES